jgi:hypothetical protein
MFASEMPGNGVEWLGQLGAVGLSLRACRYTAAHSITAKSAKIDPPAKSDAARASHKELPSRVMIATLTTKSAHHPMITSSDQAIGGAR